MKSSYRIYQQQYRTHRSISFHFSSSLSYFSVVMMMMLFLARRGVLKASSYITPREYHNRQSMKLYLNPRSSYSKILRINHITTSVTNSCRSHYSKLYHQKGDNNNHNNDDDNDKIGHKTRTQYTIDDQICLPTDPTTLSKIVYNHSFNLNKFKTYKPIAKHTQQAFNETKHFIFDYCHNQENKRQTYKKEIKSNSDDKNSHDSFKSVDIILDSGCGTGRSTLLLARKHPDCIIIGIDRSLSRLQRNNSFRRKYDAENYFNDDDEDEEESIQLQQEDDEALDSSRMDETIMVDMEENKVVTCTIPDLPNVLLVRAELSDFWRCCLEEKDWNIQKHYILHPNPYPKKARLKSRWYAHPAFPIILQLGGDIIIRSNWKQYLEEFRLSVLYCSEAFKKMKQDNPSIMMEEMIITSYVDSVDKSDSILLVPFDESFVPMTNFEKKYFSCGERFYELSMIDSNKNKVDVDEK